MNFRFWNLNPELRTPACAKRSDEGRPNSELLFPNKGFTLIEIVIVIVILAIAAGITIKFLGDSVRIYTMTVNQKTLFDEGKLALEKMCRDIRDAQSVTSVTAGPPGSITFTRTHLTATDNPNNSITFWQNTTPFPNTLEKTNNNTGSSGILAIGVTSFTVANAANEIQLQLTLSLTSGENVTLQTRVYPKNLPKDTTYKNFCRNWMEAYQ
jgi:prepilin-type N-terminal cleavage/methylation domain-containing protein